jgi:CheY-like chemotaxis protein
VTLAFDGTLRVLIIDGDNVRRGMLACTLPAARYSLEFAKTAERGLDLLGQAQPAVVIVGLDSSSRDLCQRIRSRPAGASCTLVLMDERFRDETSGESEAEAAGADTFLPFPFESALFDERLSARRRPSTAAEPVPPAESSSFPVPSGILPQASDAPGPPDGTEEVAWRSFRERVTYFQHNLESLDYYQLLEIPTNASAASIKDAYFRCSMEFHPDRFMQLTDEGLRQGIYDVYKRMSEAFKVLIQPEARSHYDAALLGDDREGHLRYLDSARDVLRADDHTGAAITAGGKRYLHFANLADAEGNLRSARMYLTLALQCEPHNNALRARLDAVTHRLEG